MSGKQNTLSTKKLSKCKCGNGRYEEHESASSTRLRPTATAVKKLKIFFKIDQKQLTNKTKYVII